MRTYITSASAAFIVSVAITGLSAVNPSYASAATVYLEASSTTLSVGDTAVVGVKIDTNAAVVNTIQGDVILKPSGGNSTMQSFDRTGSTFSLWPRTPSLSKDGLKVSFVGGVPGGFNGQGRNLFKIIIQATATGTFTLTPQSMSVFANDGAGTKLPVQAESLTFNVIEKNVPVVAGMENTPARPNMLTYGSVLFVLAVLIFFSGYATWKQRKNGV